jgi:hypothetical protein
MVVRPEKVSNFRWPKVKIPSWCNISRPSAQAKSPQIAGITEGDWIHPETPAVSASPGLSQVLEFLDLRFVTGDEGLDKVTNWLGFRWEFEAMLGNVHPSI